VLEASIRERGGLQVKPVPVLNVPRPDSRVCESRITGLQFIVIQQRETRLPIQNSLTVEN
jgi:hypothetical protein